MNIIDLIYIYITRSYYFSNLINVSNSFKSEMRCKLKTLYSLAALANVARGTQTGVCSHQFYAAPSVHAAELQTVIHLILTVFPGVSRLTVTLVVCQQVLTCAVDAGTWQTLVYLRLTQFPLPACAAAAVKLIKLVLTHSQVEAWLGITNLRSLAPYLWLLPPQSREAAHLRGIWDFYEWQVDSAHSHLPQTPSVFLSQPDSGVIEEVEAAADAEAVTSSVPIHSQAPAGRRLSGIHHGQLDVMPRSICDGSVACERQELCAHTTVQFDQEGGVE